MYKDSINSFHIMQRILLYGMTDVNITDVNQEAGMPFSMTVEISFGDCDPAGIVFYPNYFRWFDATYNAFLKNHGLDQRILRDRLGTIGTGLMDVGASFRSPAQFGDSLVLHPAEIEWHARSFRIAYQGFVGDRLVVEGHELRGVFMQDGDRLKAAPVAPLRELIEAR